MLSFVRFRLPGTQRIGSDIDIGASAVLMCEPAEVTKYERTLQGHKALGRGGRNLSKKKSDRLTGENQRVRKSATGWFIVAPH
jgi:hypothetical protein